MTTFSRSVSFTYKIYDLIFFTSEQYFTVYLENILIVCPSGSSHFLAIVTRATTNMDEQVICGVGCPVL